MPQQSLVVGSHDLTGTESVEFEAKVFTQLPNHALLLKSNGHYPSLNLGADFFR